MTTDLDRAGRSPLHYASVDADEAAARELIDSGADVNLADRCGLTPLYFAAQAQSPSITALLLDAGADLNVQNAVGSTPLHENRAGITPEALGRGVANYDLVTALFTDDPVDS